MLGCLCNPSLPSLVSRDSAPPVPKPALRKDSALRSGHSTTTPPPPRDSGFYLNHAKCDSLGPFAFTFALAGVERFQYKQVRQ